MVRTSKPPASFPPMSFSSPGVQRVASAARMLAFALFAALLALAPARAHEIQASVADIDVSGGRVVLDVRTGVETWLAGISPDVGDTDASPQAAEYDRLRSLPAEELEARIRDFAPRIVEAFDVAVTDGVQHRGSATLELTEIEVEPVGDVELGRTTRLRLEAPMPLTDITIPTAVTVRLDPSLGDLILRGTGENQAYGEYLQAGTPSQEIAVSGVTQRGAGEVFVQYLGVGFEHILPLGLDHILFVIGLFLLQPRVRPLLWQVTAFTLAHSVTLALGALDIVRVPGSIVEPLIALSIVYVCVENIVSSKLHAWRPLVIFAFGLLHGLGFASVFEEYGIPEGQFLSALAAFNIGVEIGQLTVIAACFLAVGLWFRNKDWYRSAISIPASMVIAAIGLYWSVTRVGLVPEFIPYI